MKYQFFKDNLGQTSLEYMLLLAVSVGLGLTFFKKMDEWMISNPNSFVGKRLNSYRTILKADPKYKRFSLPR
jgi:hypothetical protein